MFSHIIETVMCTKYSILFLYIPQPHAVIGPRDLSGSGKQAVSRSERGHFLAKELKNICDFPVPSSSAQMKGFYISGDSALSWYSLDH